MKTYLFYLVLMIFLTVDAQNREEHFPFQIARNLSTDVVEFSFGKWSKSISDNTILVRTDGIKTSIGPFKDYGYMIFFRISESSNHHQVEITKLHQQLTNGLSFSIVSEGDNLNGIGLNVLAGHFNKSNGLLIHGLFGLAERHNGVSISLLGNIHHKSKGVALSVIGNLAYEMYGFQVGFINRVINEGFGIQIGLFNKATNFKGIQLGFWNKNQKRSLPIINWNFK